MKSRLWTWTGVACLLSSLIVLPVVLQAADEGRPLRVSRYRNLANRTHAFTTQTDAQKTLAPEFTQENIPAGSSTSPFFYVYTEQYGSTIPIHHLRASNGSSVLAATDQERRALLGRGLVEAGPSVFVYDRKVEGSSEVFRIANPRDGDLLYTTSPEEKDFYIRQGWVQMASLGFAQSTASSGTGILRDSTVKLEADDLPLVSGFSAGDRKITFGGINSKILGLTTGTVIYSEKSSIFPLGLVAKVESVSRNNAGELEVTTQPADLSDAFLEFHLYLANQPVYFLPEEGNARAASDAPLPVRQSSPEQAQNAAVGDKISLPEYLAVSSPSAASLLPDSATWSRTLTFPNQVLYTKTVGQATSSLSVGGYLTLDTTVDLIYGYKDTDKACVLNPHPTIVFLLTPHAHGNLNITASGDISKTLEQRLLAPITVPVPLAGPPVSISLALYAGFDAAASVTAKLDVDQDASMTVGVEYDTTNMALSPIFCSPCPAGFTCPCAFPLPSFTGSITVDAQAKVYLRPEMFLFAGTWGTGIGPTAYTKLQLRAALEPPNINLYTEVIPGLGAKIMVANCDLKTLLMADLDKKFWISKLVKSFPLAVAPTVSSFKLNNGAAATTSVNVILNSTASGTPTKYMASESSTFSGAAWQAYGAAPSFTLSPALGAKTVYFKVQNSAGTSAVTSASITLMATPAVTSFKINNGAASTTNVTVTLNNAASGSPSQYMASESSTFGGAAWQTYSTAPSFTLSAAGGAKTVYFKVQNNAAASTTTSAGITLIVPPVVTSFKIDSGAATTTSTAVTLNNTATGTPTQYMASESSTFSGAAWQTYATAPTFTLSAAGGAKTVYFKAQNSAGASAVVTASITRVVKPTVTAFKINNGATSTTNTTVTLNNTATGTPTQYMASESSAFAGASWQTYSTAPTFTLSASAGAKTIFFKVQNAAGPSIASSASITLSVPPAVTSFKINNGAASTTSPTVTLNNAASGTPTQYMASEASTFSGAAWQTYSAAPSFTLSAGGGTKTIYFKTQNSAGPSAVTNASITRVVAPAVTSFKINSGAATTTSATVTLNNTASGVPAQYLASESSGFSGASWQAYSTAPTFTLSAGAGAKTVYFKVQNAAGASSVTTASISRLVAPAVTSFKINNGATSTTSATVTLNNTASGTPTQYMASESSGFSGAAWQTYSTAPGFTLSAGGGTKTVYFKVQNAAGSSAASAATITRIAPPGVIAFKINNGATSSTSTSVTLSNSASGAPTQYMASESSSFSGASWQTYSTSVTFTLSAAGGAKTIYFKLQNSAGPSAVTSASITLVVPPTVTVFKINNGATSTTSRTVTLNNTASGSPTQYIASASSSFAGAAWQTYSTAPTFTLSSTKGTQTVYFKTQNAAGASSVKSAQITLK